MSSLLRQSSSSLAKLSRSALLARRTPINITASRISTTQIRCFATPPPPKKLEKKTVQKKDDANVKPAKSAPGTENLYDGKSPLSSSPEPAKKNEKENENADPENQPLAPGMTRLEGPELEMFEKTLETMKKGLPQEQVQAVDQALAQIKKNGIPNELKELIDETREKGLTLASAAKLVRLTSKMARQLKEGGVEENTTKTGSAGTGAGGSGSGKKPKFTSNANFKSGSIKLDTSTILLSTFVSYLMYQMVMPGEAGKDISYQEFKTAFLDKGLVESLTVIGGTRVRVNLHREAVQSTYPDSPATNPNFHYFFSIGSVDAFENKLEHAQDSLEIPSSDRIPVNYTEPSSSVLSLLFSFGPTLLLLGGIYWMSKKGGQANSGIFGVGKSRAKQFNHETDVKVKFADVAGMDEAKLEIMEFVSFLKTPEKFERLGAKIPRGAILSGPPGTGKTLLAKATAGESQVPFFSVSGSEFVEMFVGVGASRVRDLFAMARKSTPCIIFIDEIDAIGKARGKSGAWGGGNEEREATLNQILTEMDGFNTQEQVVVLAGTNRPDVLDKALMRPGRFDRHIAIDRPTMDGRKQIFSVHLGKIVTNENIEYLTGRLAALTPGFSGADIANCCNEAALIAARTSAKSVAMIHFEQAIERVIGGLEKKSLVLSPEEKKTVAYHEAGHAICGWYFKYADPLLKVSIIPRGQGALGYAQYLPAADTYLMNVNQLMDRMAMTLGGRVSEELHFESVTSGASDDFNKVTRMATAMVTKWGMSKKLGPLHFEDDENRFNKPFAESTAQTIDSEVRRIVDEAYMQCKDLLVEKKTEVGIVAEELLKKEMLSRDDMVRLLGKRPWDENKDFVKYFGGGDSKSAPPPFPSESTDSPPEAPTPVI